MENFLRDTQSDSQKLAAMERDAQRLAAIVGAERRLLPHFGKPSELIYTGMSYVDFDGTYHYVYVERGEEFSHRTTKNPDEVLYWIMRDVTSEVATSFELQHRIPGQDFRRLLFSHQLELLSRLHVGWHDRAEQEQQEILRRSPFRD